MIATEAVKFDNINATTASFLTLGGFYNATVIATFGGGSVELQQLAEDGATWVSLLFPFNNAGVEVDLVIGKFTANGMKQFILAAGQYRFLVTTATAVYASLTRVLI